MLVFNYKITKFGKHYKDKQLLTRSVIRDWDFDQWQGDKGTWILSEEGDGWNIVWSKGWADRPYCKTIDERKVQGFILTI